MFNNTKRLIAFNTFNFYFANLLNKGMQKHA